MYRTDGKDFIVTVSPDHNCDGIADANEPVSKYQPRVERDSTLMFHSDFALRNRSRVSANGYQAGCFVIDIVYPDNHPIQTTQFVVAHESDFVVGELFCCPCGRVINRAGSTRKVPVASSSVVEKSSSTVDADSGHTNISKSQSR
jgi:hypothetical protein